MPDDFLFLHADLASELFDLLIFHTGRQFEDKKTAGNENGWSKIVWDFLETGLKKGFNRKNSGWKGSGRYAGDTLQALDGRCWARATGLSVCRTATELLTAPGASMMYSSDDGVPPDNGNLDRGSEEPEHGVSIVLIETSEGEARE